MAGSPCAPEGLPGFIETIARLWQATPGYVHETITRNQQRITGPSLQSLVQDTARGRAAGSTVTCPEGSRGRSRRGSRRMAGRAAWHGGGVDRPDTTATDIRSDAR